MNVIPALCLLLVASSAFAQGDSVSQVDPFIGTQTSSQLDNGNTVPGATRPFGMLYWSPDPPDGGMYRYEHPVTRGFSLMHLSGPGCGVFGNVPIFPMLGLPSQPPPVLPLSYQAGYSHADEVAQPGYYAVKLDSGIEVQIAAGVHSGISELKYPLGTNTHTVLLDLSRDLDRMTDAHLQVQGAHITGSIAGGAFCGLQNHYKVYFSVRTEEAPQSSGTFDELRLNKAGKSASGTHAGGYLSFAPATSTIHLKVGLSFVSIANADENLAREIPGWDLAKVRGEATAAWSDALSHALVSGGTDTQRKVFYTALYHALLHPSVFSDVNGQYIGFDEKIHTVKGRVQYANYSGWDIYRSQVQLITMFMPKVGSDIAQSLVVDAEQGGGLPIWPVANDESSCMVGDPSDPILASIYAFGGRDFDTKAALRAMVKGAEDPSVHVRLYPERPGLAEFLAKGYISESAESKGSASVTLEDENADFSISQFAKALGDEAMASKYLSRAAEWHKLFDPESHYIRARDTSGNFLPNFKPENYDGFVEGNSAQYTWMIPYDLKGVIEAVGGPKAVNERLDGYFSKYGSYMLDRGPYFYIANEPSFGNPWIYNWSGQPWRTQQVVRKTLTDLFTAAPDGEPGNDDLGATSAWVVFAQLGIYPEIPGVGGFTINSPVFPHVILKLGTHKVEMTSPGAPEKAYVREVSLDGKRIKDWWLPWEMLKDAKQVDFKLSGEADKSPGDAPPSFAP
jgi:predicted alpha-1,2-mannosidase